ncbi:MAG: acetyl-CoA synthase subunit gamma, partial [Proteobacteria bacterium]|nr:acetyl-CoA synthase subunit gamma [Pseudomonadota bacterium]
PLLLPWLPGRAFSVKGIGLGILGALFLLILRWHDLASPATRLEVAAWILLVPAASTYLSMNFTGSSTYTSLSGVKKEMHRALPFQIGTVVVGLTLWISSIFVA